MSRTKLALIGGAAVLLIALFGATLLYSLQVLPRLSFAPPWTLINQSGEPLTSEQLKGRIVLYTLSASKTSDESRQTDALMRLMQERLLQEGEPDSVHLVSVILQEENSERKLSDLASNWGANKRYWSIASGEDAALAAMLKTGFGLFYEEQEDGFRYDPAYVLVDGMGIVRAVYRFGNPEESDVWKAVSSLLREASAATGTLRLAYEAAHLFGCYPTL